MVRDDKWGQGGGERELVDGTVVGKNSDGPRKLGPSTIPRFLND